MLLISQAWVTATEGTFAIMYEADITFVARRLTRNGDG